MLYIFFNFVAFQVTLYKGLDKPRDAFPKQFKDFFQISQWKFEEELKKGVGIKFVCVSYGMPQRHTDNDWHLDPTKDLCGSKDIFPVISEFLKKDVIILLTSTNSVTVDFRWKTIQKSDVSRDTEPTLWY